MKKRQPRCVTIGFGLTIDSERRVEERATRREERRRMESYQQCGGGRRVLRKPIGGV